jgi:hypothetical protein
MSFTPDLNCNRNTTTLQRDRRSVLLHNCRRGMRQLRRGAWVLLFVSATGCGPYLAPAIAPPVQPAFEPMRAALQSYLDQTQASRREAANQANAIPDQATSPDRAVEAVRVRERVLATAIRTTIRPAAKVGDVLSPEVSEFLRERLRTAFASPRVDLIRDELADQNEGRKADAASPEVNQEVEAPRVPPMVLEFLPPLPEQLAFAFQRRTLILRDTDANIVVDLVPDAFPEDAAPGPPQLFSGTADSNTTGRVLPMPNVLGLMTFAAIGDSGTGDTAQHSVAQAMFRYFTNSRRFSFVLMLGDNLYGDDYVGEFAVPYKDLLDRGVKFYAALGNHDRQAEIHYKPFNMGDRSYYAFTRGEVRFVAIDSNEPSDPQQAKWLETAFNDATAKWRIAFFHHPPYSSGEHERQGRDVIRPALEPLLVKSGVNVVFSGHEHLYERVAPQKGVRYFVSGGGGRRLYPTRRAEFDEVALSSLHFMVLGVADDRLFFEAIAPDDRLIDCGLIFRTPEAAAKPADQVTRDWLDQCRAARPAATTASIGRGIPIGVQ